MGALSWIRAQIHLEVTEFVAIAALELLLVRASFGSGVGTLALGVADGVDGGNLIFF
jgi:hypothetical protein